MSDDERSQSLEAKRPSEASNERGQCDKEHIESGELRGSDKDGVGEEGAEGLGTEPSSELQDAPNESADPVDEADEASLECKTAHDGDVSASSSEHQGSARSHVPPHEAKVLPMGAVVCLFAVLMAWFIAYFSSHPSHTEASRTMTPQESRGTGGGSKPHRNDEIEERLWNKWVAMDQSGDRMTEAQQSIVDATGDTKTAGEGMCLAWVNDVFESAGWEFDRLWAASEAYQIWCHSTDRHDLEPGMIVAVESTDTSPVAGHIAIYIGNGMVRDNETLDGKGVVKTRSLDEWVEMFGTVSTPKWGWAGGYDLSDPMTHPKRTRSQFS